MAKELLYFVCAVIRIIYSPEFGGSFCPGSAREYDQQLCNTNVSMHLSYSIQFKHF